MKINEIITPKSAKPTLEDASGTSSGGFAVAAMPIGSMIKRTSIYPAKSVSKKKSKKSK